MGAKKTRTSRVGRASLAVLLQRPRPSSARLAERKSRTPSPSAAWRRPGASVVTAPQAQAPARRRETKLSGLDDLANTIEQLDQALDGSDTTSIRTVTRCLDRLERSLMAIGELAQGRSAEGSELYHWTVSVLRRAVREGRDEAAEMLKRLGVTEQPEDPDDEDPVREEESLVEETEEEIDL